MAQGPESWLSLETIKEGGGWMAAGAILLGIAIKRGWVFIGDRTKLAVALAKAEKEIEHQHARILKLEADLAERDEKLGALSGGGVA